MLFSEGEGISNKKSFGDLKRNLLSPDVSLLSLYALEHGVSSKETIFSTNAHTSPCVLKLWYSALHDVDVSRIAEFVF